MISKELANYILGEEYNSLYDYNTEQIMEDSNTMSLFDFANLCKKWADKHNYSLKSYIFRNNGYCYFDDNQFICDTEPEAIFKACQWILDNKEASK